MVVTSAVAASAEGGERAKGRAATASCRKMGEEMKSYPSSGTVPLSSTKLHDPLRICACRALRADVHAKTAPGTWLGSLTCRRATRESAQALVWCDLVFLTFSNLRKLRRGSTVDPRSTFCGVPRISLSLTTSSPRPRGLQGHRCSDPPGGTQEVNFPQFQSRRVHGNSLISRSSVSTWLHVDTPALTAVW